jgi:hypothetical protein
MQARLLWRLADCSATRSWISTPEKKRRDLPGPLKGEYPKAEQENFTIGSLKRNLPGSLKCQLRKLKMGTCQVL